MNGHIARVAMLGRKFDQVSDRAGSDLLGVVRTRHGDVVGAFAADLLTARSGTRSIHLLMHEAPVVAGAEPAVDRAA